MSTPPRVVRRLVVAPLVAALDLLVLVLTPPLAVLAILLAPVTGGTRAVRAVLIVAAFCGSHLRALTALLALWAQGRASDEDAHYAVMRRFLADVAHAILRLARVAVVTEEPDAARDVLGSGPHPPRPVVLLGRHAGEGDTLLVLYELLCTHDRRPLVVMHERLRLDPLIDVLGHRLPHRFLDPRGGDTEGEIAALARDLDDRSALVIFPEGINFSPDARRRAIDRLLRRGHDVEAAAAERMEHVSPPRPGGALAAIGARPDADVVVLGHTGFPSGLGETWRLLPARQEITVRLWHTPAAHVPDDVDAQRAWLYARWAELDAWVATSASR